MKFTLLALGLITVIASDIGLFEGSLLPAQAQTSKDVCVVREKHVKSGDWRTLESYWNASGHGFFLAPAGAEIKVRYGYGLGKDRQKQKLDGQTMKKLEIGDWSVTYARMQIKVPSSTNVRYLACSGGVAKSLPNIPF